VSNLPQDLENDWGALKLSLQGKAPIKKRGKDERGWGKNVKPYSTSLGYSTFRNIPHVPPNPAI
jgi:ribonuclease HI